MHTPVNIHMLSHGHTLKLAGHTITTFPIHVALCQRIDAAYFIAIPFQIQLHYVRYPV